MCILGVETIKWQTRAAHGCLVAGQSLWARAWTVPAAYRLYVCYFCDIKVLLHLQYAACGATQVLNFYLYIQGNSRVKKI